MQVFNTEKQADLTTQSWFHGKSCNDSQPHILSLLLFVCQIEKPTIHDRLREEDSPSFPEEDIQHKLQMAAAAGEKRRETPTPVPLLFSFNSVNRPQVKISCSCQFNSASNDAATRSLFLFLLSLLRSLHSPFLASPPPLTFHPNKLSPPFLFPWAGLSCHVVLIGSTGNH